MFIISVCGMYPLYPLRTKGWCIIAYFSNGTDGVAFEEVYCARCINNDEEQGCPIMLLHTLWNYEQFPEHEKTKAGKAVAQTKKEVLDTFIVWDWKSGSAPECKMFRESVVPDNEPEFRVHADSELVPL